jgi:hypothetical protein
MKLNAASKFFPEREQRRVILPQSLSLWWRQRPAPQRFRKKTEVQVSKKNLKH